MGESSDQRKRTREAWPSGDRTITLGKTKLPPHIRLCGTDMIPFDMRHHDGCPSHCSHCRPSPPRR